MTHGPELEIGGRRIGVGHPCYIVAEMSANHGGSLDEAKRIIEAAKDAGADAIKLQTYTPDTLTIASDKEQFKIGKGTIWEGQTLYDLYGHAYTPWDWHAELQELAHSLELGFFSTPFDDSAVDFLEELNVPAHKVASFESGHLPLLQKIGATGKPVIMSTGIASFEELTESVETLRGAGCTQLGLLKCTSAYPAPAEEANLRTIPHLAETFGAVAGLSDHTLGYAVPVAAIALGASIIEKHFIRDKSVDSPDSSFSLSPAEFTAMATAVRTAEAALGEPSYELTDSQQASQLFRRSLFVVEDVSAGDPVTVHNVRIIRPGHGLPPRDYDEVLKRRFSTDVSRGTPVSWEILS